MPHLPLSEFLKLLKEQHIAHLLGCEVSFQGKEAEGLKVIVSSVHRIALWVNFTFVTLVKYAIWRRRLTSQDVVTFVNGQGTTTTLPFSHGPTLFVLSSKVSEEDWAPISSAPGQFSFGLMMEMVESSHSTPG